MGSIRTLACLDNTPDMKAEEPADAAADAALAMSGHNALDAVGAGLDIRRPTIGDVRAFVRKAVRNNRPKVPKLPAGVFAASLPGAARVAVPCC